MSSPSIPKTMKALQVTAYDKPYELNPSAPAPDPAQLGPYDLIVKIAAASHCHTDEMVRSGVFRTQLPCTGSHEGAGTVVAVGNSAQRSSSSGLGGGGSGVDVHLSSSAGGVGALSIGDTVANIASIGTTSAPSSDNNAGVTGDISSSAGGVGALQTADTIANAANVVPDSGPSQSQTFKIGDRVMCGLPYSPCSACPDCVGAESSRRGQYCANIKGHVGVHLSGNFAEFVLVDARSTTLLPDAVKLTSAAPLACAGRTVWRGVANAAVNGLTRGSGEWLAIVGSGGGLGHLGVQFARKLGYNVIGVDARDEGVAMTKSYASSGGSSGGSVLSTQVIALDARDGKEQVVKQAQAVTGGRGADATLVLSDSAGAASLSAAITKMHGTMVQIAQPENVSLPFEELVFRDIRVRGSLLCSAEESREMLDFIAEHGLDVRTNLFDGGLEDHEKVMELVKGGKIQGKAVIVVDKEQIQNDEKIGAKY